MARRKKPIRCEMCRKEFKQVNGLQGHLRFVHGVGPGGGGMATKVEKDVQELIRLKELRSELEERANEPFLGLPKDPHIEAMIRKIDDRMDEIAGIRPKSKK